MNICPKSLPVTPTTKRRLEPLRAERLRSGEGRRRPEGKTPYQRVRRPMAPESHPNPESGSFCRYLPQSRPQLGQAGGGFRQPRGTDLCFACGKPGHWRRNCQSNVGGKSKDGSSSSSSNFGQR